jgi:hypothetical protein
VKNIGYWLGRQVQKNTRINTKESPRKNMKNKIRDDIFFIFQSY